MAQRVYCFSSHRYTDIPSPTSRCGSLRWGNVSKPYTPAFWKALAFLEEPELDLRLGTSPWEEAAACALCTHGIPSEIGLAAFHHLKQKGLLEPATSSHSDIYQLLSAPLMIDGKSVRYRFAAAKSRTIAEILQLPESAFGVSSGRELRRILMGIHGIGMKIGSWIARNLTLAQDLAVLDIHILRAGTKTGLFSADTSDTPRTDREYLALEEKFIHFSGILETNPAVLDFIMWSQMRSLPFHSSSIKGAA